MCSAATIVRWISLVTWMFRSKLMMFSDARRQVSLFEDLYLSAMLYTSCENPKMYFTELLLVSMCLQLGVYLSTTGLMSAFQISIERASSSLVQQF